MLFELILVAAFALFAVFAWLRISELEDKLRLKDLVITGERANSKKLREERDDKHYRTMDLAIRNSELSDELKALRSETTNTGERR